MTLRPIQIGDYVRFRHGDDIARGIVYGFWEDGKPRIHFHGGLAIDHYDMDPRVQVQIVEPLLLSRKIDLYSDTMGTRED